MATQVPNRQQLVTSGDFVEVRNAAGQVTGHNLIDPGSGQVLRTIQSSMGPQYVGPETVANPFSSGQYEINWGENNAMNEILKRGRKADGTWDIGWVQGLSRNNITQQQMDDFSTLQSYNPLSQKYDADLKANGLNPVSFGEGESSVTRRLNQAINAPEALRLEQQRVEGLMGQTVDAENAGRRVDNSEATSIQQTESATATAAEIRKDENEYRDDLLAWQDRQGDKDRDFQIDKLGLEQNAQLKTHELEMKRWEQQNRRDSIAGLVAGLAALGAGFAF